MARNANSAAARVFAGEYSGVRMGQIINDAYKILGVLGAGGTGVAFLAEHPYLSSINNSCVKLFNSDLCILPSDETLQAISRKCNDVNAVNNSNIAKIEHIGELNGRVMVVSEYAAGESLKRILEEERWLPLEASIGIMNQVLDALSAAHAKGVVHGDLHLGNIIVEKYVSGKNARKTKLWSCKWSKRRSSASTVDSASIVDSANSTSIKLIDAAVLPVLETSLNSLNNNSLSNNCLNNLAGNMSESYWQNNWQSDSGVEPPKYNSFSNSPYSRTSRKYTPSPQSDIRQAGEVLEQMLNDKKDCDSLETSVSDSRKRAALDAIIKKAKEYNGYKTALEMKQELNKAIAPEQKAWTLETHGYDYSGNKSIIYRSAWANLVAAFLVYIRV